MDTYFSIKVPSRVDARHRTSLEALFSVLPFRFAGFAYVLAHLLNRHDPFLWPVNCCRDQAPVLPLHASAVSQ